ncbi:MAG: short-chain dehydrogenase [Robiginitomaculum sp.]|nr:MAG: short-chain dehydrogenase [Robiginitomaculum sp.]
MGEATARYLAAKGARVVLAARSGKAIADIADEIRASGGWAHAVICDVASLDDVRKLVAVTLEQTGRIDILVNNAGLIEPIALLADSDPDAWNQVIDVNIKGVYHCMRLCIPQMLEQCGGTIINISSGAAHSPLEGWSHYCATKAAVFALTGVADKEYRDQGIRVLGLSPGTVATQMQHDIRASGINPVSKLDFGVHIPPEWVAQAIEWLSDPQADAYLGTDFSLRADESRAVLGLPKQG